MERPGSNSEEARLGRSNWLGTAPDLHGGAHRVEHTLHDLLGPRTVRRVGSLGFEQLGVRQNDSQLIVELMKQRA